MLNRYRMYHRGQGVFYAKDKTTGRAESLATKDRAKAVRLLNAKNQAIDQPHLNVAMARVYLSCKSPEMLDRTWQDVMAEMELSYHGSTLKRWRTQMRCAPFQVLRKAARFSSMISANYIYSRSGIKGPLSWFFII